MGSLWQDVRYGVRTLARNRGFTAAALLSLALGSGVTSSIFSVVRAVLLTPLPYPAPDGLVLITGVKTDGADVQDWPLSFLDFRDWGDHSRTFEDVAVRTELRSFNVSGTGAPEHVDGEMVSSRYFPILGAVPILGRTFLPEEDRVPSGTATAVISFDLWKRRFGGAADLGRQDLVLGGERYRVVGVMPRGFKGLTDQAEIWVPVARASALLAPRYLEQRNFRWLSAVARLRAGTSPEQARAGMAAAAQAFERRFPETNQGIGFRVTPLMEAWYGDLRPVLLVLMMAGCFVLVIACGNVANLLVVRGLARQDELAIRTTVGASGWRLTRQLLTEAVLLALLGGALGLLCAAWSARLLAAAGPAKLRSFVDVRVDAWVVAASLAATVLCVALAALAPAVSAIRSSLAARLRQGDKGSAGRGRRRLQDLLVVAEVALSVVLLAGAGLTIQELRRLRNLDLGFRAEELLTLRLDLADRRYANDEAVRSLVRELAGRMGRVPGVRSVAFAGDVPTDEGFSTFFSLEGQDSKDGVLLRVHSVSPGYFPTLEVPLLAGRACADSDGPGAPPVVVVSRDLARRWGGESAVDKRLKPGPPGAPGPWLTVIGVAAEVRQRGLERAVQPPDLYTCLFQVPPRNPPVLSLLVRPAGGARAASLAVPLTLAAREVAAALPLYDMATLEERLDTQVSRGRFLTLLMALFSALALVLAVVGIYGVLSYSVGQRLRELGIRMALGADRAAIVRLVLGEGAGLALAGIGAGLVLALWMSRSLAGLLEGTFGTLRPLAPMTFAGAALLFLAAALLASYIPARRAARYEVGRTLREG